MRDSFERKEIIAAGGSVHMRFSRRAGRTSPPLVCVHGLGVSGKYIMPFARRIAEDMDVYVPDLPGYGASFKPAVMLSPAELADALAEMVDAMELPRADYLGNSYGCQILAEFGARHPVKVRKMVLVGPTVNAERQTFREQLWDLLVSGLHEKASLSGLLLWDMLKAGPRVMIPTIRNALEHAIEETLPRVGARTLVVRGSHDAMAPREWCAEVARLLRNGSLETIEGGGHALNYSQPDELAEVVKRFLA